MFKVFCISNTITQWGITGFISIKVKRIKRFYTNESFKDSQ